MAKKAPSKTAPAKGGKGKTGKAAKTAPAKTGKGKKAAKPAGKGDNKPFGNAPSGMETR